MVTHKKATEIVVKTNRGDSIEHAYHWLKKTALQLFGGLLMEHKNGMWTVALGRIGFWVVGGHCMSIWSRPSIVVGGNIVTPDVSAGELKVLGVLILYNLTKHGLDKLNSVATIWKGGLAGGSVTTTTPPTSIDRT